MRPVSDASRSEYDSWRAGDRIGDLVEGTRTPLQTLGQTDREGLYHR